MYVLGTAVHRVCSVAGVAKINQDASLSGMSGTPAQASSIPMRREQQMLTCHMQVRGMANKKVTTSDAPPAAKPPKSRAARQAAVAQEKRKEEVVVTQTGASLKAGEAFVVYECPSPIQFVLLSSFSLLQVSGWVWMIGSNVLGFSTGSVFIVSNWWCAFGLALSSAMATMTYWHSGHHLVRLVVKPGLVDEYLVTTHNMFGGERTREASRFEVVPSKGALQEIKNVSRPKHLQIRGHGNLIIDSSGVIHDSLILHRIVKGEAVMPSLIKIKNK